MIETPALCDVLVVSGRLLANDPTDKELLAYKLPDDLQER